MSAIPVAEKSSRKVAISEQASESLCLSRSATVSPVLEFRSGLLFAQELDEHTPETNGALGLNVFFLCLQTCASRLAGFTHSRSLTLLRERFVRRTNAGQWCGGTVQGQTGDDRDGFRSGRSNGAFVLIILESADQNCTQDYMEAFVRDRLPILRGHLL